jgi:hypothetical protein
MRKPEDKRCIEVVNEAWLMPKLRCAVNELILVLMVDAMVITPVKSSLNPATCRSQRQHCCWPL